MDNKEIDNSILKKAEALNAIRFVGAMCVVFFHYNKFTGTSHDDVSFPFFNILGNVYTRGGIWVEFFFLLSGFTFFAVYEKRICNKQINLIDFCKKRIIRLFPLYYFTTLCTVIIVFISNKYIGDTLTGFDDLNMSIKYIVINILGIGRGWIENVSYPYNAPAWTISVDIFCYLIFLFICRYISKSQIRVFLCTLLSLCGYKIVMSGYQYPIINTEMARGIACFFFGGILCYIQRDIEKRKLNTIVSFISIVILIIYCFNSKILYTWRIISYLVFPSLLLLVVNSKYLNNFFKMSFWKKSGDISFSIYLNQIPVMAFLFLLSKLSFDFNFYSITFLMLYLIVLIIVSIFTYNTVEKYGKRLFKKILKDS